MKTSEIKVGAEYAMASKEWEKRSPSRVVVTATNVTYTGYDSSSRIYARKTMTGGVQVLHVRNGREEVVRPAAILHTWEEEMELAAKRAEYAASKASLKATMNDRTSDLVDRLNAVLPEGTRKLSLYDRTYKNDLGYHTGIELSAAQVEALLGLIES